jgi:hypothetical protein
VLLAYSTDNASDIAKAILTSQFESLNIEKDISTNFSKKEIQQLVGSYQFAPNFVMKISDWRQWWHCSQSGLTGNWQKVIINRPCFYFSGMSAVDENILKILVKIIKC